jgi:hypothetical protein
LIWTQSPQVFPSGIFMHVLGVQALSAQQPCIF